MGNRAGSSPVTRTISSVHNGLDRYEHFFILSKVWVLGITLTSVDIRPRCLRKSIENILILCYPINQNYKH